MKLFSVRKSLLECHESELISSILAKHSILHSGHFGDFYKYTLKHEGYFKEDVISDFYKDIQF